MKVFVAAIDGLEYNLVVRWNLRNLMQEYYGKHDVTVAVRPGEPLYTPFIWASFLLGKPSYEVGFDLSSRIEQANVEAYGKVLGFLYKVRFRLLGRRSLGIRKILAKLGLFNIERYREARKRLELLPSNLVEETIVSWARENGYRVWIHEFPSLLDHEHAEHRLRTLTEVMEMELNKRIEFLMKVLRQELEVFRRAIKALENHDLILYYASVIDEANHLLYRPRNLRAMTWLRAIYGSIDKALADLRRHHCDDVAILVISDHGYDPERHDHSTYGFWSLNVKPPWIPSKITDFRFLIEEFLRR